MMLSKYREQANRNFKYFLHIIAVLILIVFVLIQLIAYRGIVFEDLFHDVELQSKIIASFVHKETNNDLNFWINGKIEQKIKENIDFLEDKKRNIISIKMFAYEPQTSRWHEIVSITRNFTTVLSPFEKRISHVESFLSHGPRQIVYNGEGFIVRGISEVVPDSATRLKTVIDVEANKFVRQQVHVIMIFASILVVIFTGLVIQYRLLAITLYQPLDNLINGMKTISQGNLEYRVPVLRRDKLGKFIESFNDMVGELKKARENLEEELLITKHQREKIFQVYRDVIFAVTQGKLLLVNTDELLPYLGEGQQLAEIFISKKEDVRLARKVCREVINEQRPHCSIINKVLLCVSEAATNILKHAGTGTFVISRVDTNCFRFIFKDNGPGMDFSRLPSALFYKGFSTSASLGYGFSIIYTLSDKMILSSTKNGTTVVCDVLIRERQENIGKMKAL